MLMGRLFTKTMCSTASIYGLVDNIQGSARNVDKFAPLAKNDRKRACGVSSLGGIAAPTGKNQFPAAVSKRETG
jgi:hypothetical protein